jgi:hypothetical protein
MLKINNLHATKCSQPIRRALSLAFISFAALALTACGNISVEDGKEAASSLLPDIQTLTEKLPPEARAVMTAYTGDLRNAVAAYQAEFGRFPASLADIASLTEARTTAVNLLADGMGDQIPFASRATVEQAADSIVTAAERQVLDQMRTQNAPNQ